MTQFTIGQSVRFKPGPRSTSSVVAKVTGTDGQFLLTKDSAGKDRKVRPGACTAA